MSIYNCTDYMNQVKELAELSLPWERLKGKSIAISGATGMIGSMLVDAIMYRNEYCGQNTAIYALSRSEQKAAARFVYDEWAGEEARALFHIVEADITKAIPESVKADYIIHAASATHPRQYSEDPIGTIAANVLGTNNLLSYADACACSRFVFLSSVEIYGECDTTTPMDEKYLGYIDSNTLRAGYPESKRTGEALCQAYKKQCGLDVVSVRLSRVYGPTLLKSDTKALSQFIGKALNKEDIVLKSEGNQFYSYCYSFDAVSAILFLMFNGENGEAYNVASKDSDITLRELAGYLAGEAGTKVVFDIPEATEAAGYSKATRAILNTDKIKSLGWSSEYDIKKGLGVTLKILQSNM